MSLPVIPDFFPNPSQAYQVEPEAAVRRNVMDNGMSRQRLRWTKRIRTVSVRWLLTDAKLNWFNGFWKLELRSGQYPFLLDMAFGGSGCTQHQAQFVGDFDVRMSGSFHWELSAVLEVDEIEEDVQISLSVPFIRAYKLEDLTDSKGNADLVASGTPVSVAGKNNDAFEYDGVSEYHESDWVPSSSSWSVSIWLNPSSFSGAAYVGAHDLSDHRCYLGFNSSGRFVIGVGDGFAIDGPSQTTGQFYHLVVTWDGSGSSKGYLNSVLKVTDSITFSGSSSENFAIGTALGFTSFVDGVVDEVYIFDGELQQSDVDLLYNSGAGNFYDDFTQ